MPELTRTTTFFNGFIRQRADLGARKGTVPQAPVTPSAGFISSMIS